DLAVVARPEVVGVTRCIQGVPSLHEGELLRGAVAFAGERDAYAGRREREAVLARGLERERALAGRLPEQAAVLDEDPEIHAAGELVRAGVGGQVRAGGGLLAFHLRETELRDALVLGRSAEDHDAGSRGRPEREEAGVAARATVVPVDAVVALYGVDVPAEGDLAGHLLLAHGRQQRRHVIG